MEERWRSLIYAGRIAEDAVQLRAVSVVDDMYLNIFKSHRSLHDESARLDSFDLGVFRPRNSDHNDHDKVADYTRELARLNKQRLLQQKNPKISISDSVKSLSVPSPVPQVINPVEHVFRAETLPASLNGLYIFGSVGRGKTMLMNTLCDVVDNESPSARVRRIHFFEFMQDIHQRLTTGSGASVEQVANDLANEVDLLLLDEVAITDIQDCSIFPSVVQIFLKRNVAMVMTSNQHPQNLYIEGLNRHIYLPPLLRLIKSHCRLLSLDDALSKKQIDHRARTSQSLAWILSKAPTASPTSTRSVVIPLSATRTWSSGEMVKNGEVVQAKSDDLIEGDLGEFDFIEIAKYLKRNRNLRLELIVQRPFTNPTDILGPTRRFCKLIEILYDEQVQLTLVSPVERIEDLFSLTNLVVTDESGSLASSLAQSTVGEALRAIQRCTSRLSQAHTQTVPLDLP